MACKTVVWSRRLKASAIAGSERSVSSRVRYMASWRARATRSRAAGGEDGVDARARGGRRRPPGPGGRPAERRLGARSRPDGSARSTESGVTAEAVREEWATTRVRAPLSTRRLAEVLEASARRASGGRSSGCSRARLPRKTRRVARSGGSTGTVRPHSKRSRRRSTRPESSAGHAIGGQHELRAAFIEGVEGVEELVGGPRLAFEELDVVDQQHVRSAVALLEGVDAGALQRGDELVGEGLGGRVVDGELWAWRWR